MKSNIRYDSVSQLIKELKKFEINKEEFTYNRHVLLNYWNKIKPKDLNFSSKGSIGLTSSVLPVICK